MSSSFSVQNPRTRLVKIDNVCFDYLATASVLSALLSITHKNVHCTKFLRESIKTNVFRSGKCKQVEENIDEFLYKDQKEKQSAEFLLSEVI